MASEMGAAWCCQLMLLLLLFLIMSSCVDPCDLPGHHTSDWYLKITASNDQTKINASHDNHLALSLPSGTPQKGGVPNYGVPNLSRSTGSNLLTSPHSTHPTPPHTHPHLQ